MVESIKSNHQNVFHKALFYGDKYNLYLLLVLLLSLLLRIYLASDSFLHEWDERFHALVAKNLLNHPLKPTLYDNPVLPYDYREWSANHIWLHKQPLPLWLIALSYKLFGISEFSTRIPSILLSTLSVYITFVIGARLFNKKTALLAAWFHATNGLIVEMAAGRVATDHYDSLFLVFIELGILFAILFHTNRKTSSLLVSAVFIAAAVLTKWLPAFIIYPVWLAYISKKEIKGNVRYFLLHFLTVCLIAGAWQWHILSAYPQEARWEYLHQLMHINTTLDEQGGGPFYFFGKLFVSYNELFLLILGFAMYKLFQKNPQRPVYLALLIWIILPVLFFSFARTKMQGYILFVAPALFLLAADFFYSIKAEQGQRWKRGFYRFIQVCLVLLPLRYSTERLKLFEPYARSRPWVTELKEFKKNIPEGKVVLVNYPHPIDAMFYTDATAYSHLPDASILDSLKAKGYAVVVYYNEPGPSGERFRNF